MLANAHEVFDRSAVGWCWAGASTGWAGREWPFGNGKESREKGRK